MRPRLSGLFVAALVVLVAILIGWGFASLWTLRADFEESQSDFAASQQDVTALRDQLIDLGQTPRVDPRRGERGETGDRGSSGRDGRDGRNGIDGMTPPCYFAPTQCIGPPGPAGRDGIDGQDGAPGVQGAAGPAGPRGDPGPPGPAGANGQPPQSFTFTWANRTYICTDADGNGAYECVDNDPVPA